MSSSMCSRLRHKVLLANCCLGTKAGISASSGGLLNRMGRIVLSTAPQDAIRMPHGKYDAAAVTAGKRWAEEQSRSVLGLVADASGRPSAREYLADLLMQACPGIAVDRASLWRLLLGTATPSEEQVSAWRHGVLSVLGRSKP